MFYTQNFKDEDYAELIDAGCMNLYSKLRKLSGDSRFPSLFDSFGELSFTNLFMQGLIRHYGHERLNFFTELGVYSETENARGLVDLVIEDTCNDNKMLLIEAKCFRNENLKNWADADIMKHFEANIKAQFDSYIKLDYCKNALEKSAIVICFSKFTRDGWLKSIDTLRHNEMRDDAFYAFDTFLPNTQNPIGLAIYGQRVM
jgi:hypothetical protein